MIKFSVVIPLYNKEKEVVSTIKSIISQSYPPDEIIVVDDGSTDNSAKVVENFFKEKVKLVYQKNLGVSAARNRGIAEAKNEYICFLDADDLWEIHFLDEIEKLIKCFPEAIFYSTSHKNIDEEGKYFKSKIKFDESYRGIVQDFAGVFRDNYGLINSSSVCLQKSSGVVFPEGEKKGEDLCLWLMLSVKGKLAFSAKPFSIYRLNASNRSSDTNNDAIVPCPLKWFYKNQEVLKQEQNYRNIRRFIYANILVTVYGGFSLKRDYTSINAVINLMKENNDLRYLLLYPAYLVPFKLLDLFKKIRRKMR